MIHAGSYDLFADAFPNEFLPDVFSVILDQWPHSQRPAGNPLENRITNRFVGHLDGVMRRKDGPCFKFICRPKLADPDADSESGEVDIYIHSFSPHPDAYFVFECKRLNVRTASGFDSNVSDYVGVKGMGCFISTKYPATCDCGGMLGYVMDGNTASATAAVNGALGKKVAELNLQPPHRLHQAAIAPHEPRVRQTKHSMDHQDFVIYHLFLEY